MALKTIGFVLCLLSGAEPAPCATGTIAVEVTSTGDVQNLTTALACEGKGAFDITWFLTVEITETIDVVDSKNVTVTGNGFPSIRGSETGIRTGLFSVSIGSTLRLNGLVLEGGDAETGGAVFVHSSSSLFVFGCIFADNGATEGGAIYLDGKSTLHIGGSTSFFNNHAEGNGGAMFIHGSEVTMNGNTSFYHNSASEEGGAIEAYDESVVNMDGNISFLHNSAGDFGGAMYCSSGCVCNMDGTAVFADNSAGYSGGAIEAYDESVVNMDGNISFLHNSAGDFGGAMYYSSGCVCNMDGTAVFADNSAGYYGGAIEAYYESVVNMDGNISFLHNSAGDSGGAMFYTHGCVCNVDGTAVFTNNSAGCFGGAIDACEESAVNMDGNTSFLHNSAGQSGGAVSMFADSTINFDGTTYFAQNSASEFGGAMYASDDCVVNMDGNTIFADNVVEFNGGGIYLLYSNSTIDGNSLFVANSASIGGGIECYGGSLFIASKGAAWFTGNNAREGGGAIALSSTTGIKVYNTTFTSNTAKVGGAISLGSTNFHRRVYENCIFMDNMATEGGAVYFFSGAGVDYVASSVFINNYASTGGAVYSVGALDLDGTSFVGNRADKEGIAMFVDSLFASSRVYYANVSFTDNAFFCPRGEYGYDAVNANLSRFETVCRGCSAVPNKIPDSVEVSDERRTPSCVELPPGTVGVSSGTTVASLTLKEGYFRTSNESRVIIECYRSEACVGGNDPGHYCADGYKGPYCSICEEGFSRGFAYSCKECSNTGRGPALALMLTLAGVALLLVGLRLWSLGAVEGHDTVRGNEMSPGFARSTCSSRHWWIMKRLPLSAIKIVVVVWQVVYEFSSIAEAVYPRQYERFVSYLGFATFDIGILVWFSCVFSPDFFGRLLFATIAPLVVLLVLGGAYYAVKKYSSNSNRGMVVVRDRYLSAALFVVFFVYSSVSSTVFQTFNCDLLDDAVHYLQADYSLTCWTPKHKAYIMYASLMVVIYPLGIPSLFLWWLVRNRTLLKMSDRHTMSHLKPFDSLWGTYRPSRYYYEVVECGRRITLSAASVFFIPNSVNQIAVVLSLALVFLFVSESLSPFEKHSDMGLYRWGNGVILASMFVALLIRADGSPDGSEKFSVLGGVLITANVVMIVAVLVQSVFLARECRGSNPTPEEVIHPVERHPSRSSRRAHPVSLAGVEDDRWD